MTNRLEGPLPFISFKFWLIPTWKWSNCGIRADCPDFGRSPTFFLTTLATSLTRNTSRRSSLVGVRQHERHRVLAMRTREIAPSRKKGVVEGFSGTVRSFQAPETTKVSSQVSETFITISLLCYMFSLVEVISLKSYRGFCGTIVANCRHRGRSPPL